MKDEFLESLAILCDQYNATFYYTTNDDGIHIDLGDENIFIGHMGSDASHWLRKRINRANDNP